MANTPRYVILHYTDGEKRFQPANNIYAKCINCMQSNKKGCHACEKGISTVFKDSTLIDISLRWDHPIYEKSKWPIYKTRRVTETYKYHCTHCNDFVASTIVKWKKHINSREHKAKLKELGFPPTSSDEGKIPVF